MVEAAGDEGMRWMTELCNAVVRDGKIPKDWSRSWLVKVYMGEEDALALLLLLLLLLLTDRLFKKLSQKPPAVHKTSEHKQTANMLVIKSKTG